MRDTITFKANSIADYKAKLAAVKTLGMKVHHLEVEGWFATESVKEAKDTNASWMVKEYGIMNDDDFRAFSYHKVKSVGNVWIEVTLPDGDKDKTWIRFPLYPTDESESSYKFKDKASLIIHCVK